MTVVDTILDTLSQFGESVSPQELKKITSFIQEHEEKNPLKEFNCSVPMQAIPGARPRAGKAGFYDPNHKEKKLFLETTLKALNWSPEDIKYFQKALKEIGKRIPDKLSDAEKEAILALKEEYKEFFSSRSLFCGQGCIALHFYIPFPEGLAEFKKKLAIAGYIRPEKRPDIDNYAKFVMDAINRVFYSDDGQIISANLELFYCRKEDVRVDISFVYRDKPLF